MKAYCTEQKKVISIHTFLAEGDVTSPVARMYSFISIHTFLAEGDTIVRFIAIVKSISIHTFLAEGDSILIESAFDRVYFNPHLPCGR